MSASNMLPCISILQPYAWLIVNGHKDIENRGWPTKFRGRILIHAGKTYSRKTHDEYVFDMEEYGIELPCFVDMQLGGIVGSATITDCVQEHPSRWKILGTWGFVLAQQRVRPFVPYRGQLGIFRVPAAIIDGSACAAVCAAPVAEARRPDETNPSAGPAGGLAEQGGA